MYLKAMMKGLATYVPMLFRWRWRKTGGTIDPRYCYSVWLRHLAINAQHGLKTVPPTVAELGPGDSLGIGLMALLTGAETYFAFDLIEYWSTQRNQTILDELIALLCKRAPIPGPDEYPGVRPLLDSYDFPADLLPDDLLDRCLDEDRIGHIRSALDALPDGRSGPIRMSYRVPWYDSDLVERESVDMIFSQAVFEHIDELPITYQRCGEWLKPGGLMSHVVDFGSHGVMADWNGHWACSDLAWRIMRGRRPFLINREPCSTHLHFLEHNGFEVHEVKRSRRESDISRAHLAQRFRDLSDEDLNTKDATILATKRQ